MRLPAKGMLPEVPLTFADQDWKRPDRARYMACLAERRPALATVLDWERPDQLPEVLSWAEEAAQYVREAVLVVPKVSGMIGRIPRRVGGKDVWLAYSVPTSYGGSPIFLDELRGWPAHLLGGSPHRQHETWLYLRGICAVNSLDGNMVKKQATGRCLYWTRAVTDRGHWQALEGLPGEDGPLECVRRSCRNVIDAWHEWRAA